MTICQVKLLCSMLCIVWVMFFSCFSCCVMIALYLHASSGTKYGSSAFVRGSSMLRHGSHLQTWKFYTLTVNNSFVHKLSLI